MEESTRAFHPVPPSPHVLNTVKKVFTFTSTFWRKGPNSSGPNSSEAGWGTLLGAAGRTSRKQCPRPEGPPLLWPSLSAPPGVPDEAQLSMRPGHRGARWAGRAGCWPPLQGGAARPQGTPCCGVCRRRAGRRSQAPASLGPGHHWSVRPRPRGHSKQAPWLHLPGETQTLSASAVCLRCDAKASESQCL